MKKKVKKKKKVKIETVFKKSLNKSCYLSCFIKEACPNFDFTSLGKKGIYFIFSYSDPKVSEKYSNSKLLDECGKPFPKKYLERKLKVKKIEGYKILYIGQTSDGLKKRVNALYKTMFIEKGSLNHKGGRALSQIDNSCELLVSFISDNRCNPRKLENELLMDYVSYCGDLPFANMEF